MTLNGEFNDLSPLLTSELRMSVGLDGNMSTVIMIVVAGAGGQVAER